MRNIALFKHLTILFCLITFSIYIYFLGISLSLHPFSFSKVRWVQVSDSDIQLAEKPVSNAKHIKRLHLGERLEILTEQPDWFEVRDSRGYIGWVSRRTVVYFPPGLQ